MIPRAAAALALVAGCVTVEPVSSPPPSPPAAAPAKAEAEPQGTSAWCVVARIQDETSGIFCTEQAESCETVRSRVVEGGADVLTKLTSCTHVHILLTLPESSTAPPDEILEAGI